MIIFDEVAINLNLITLNLVNHKNYSMLNVLNSSKLFSQHCFWSDSKEGPISTVQDKTGLVSR